MEVLQKKFENELKKYQQLQTDLSKHINQRQTLESQLTENQFVKEEFDLLKSEDTVFKLIGPILVKQEFVEAKQTVDKRIDYIKSEITRHEKAIKELESKQDELKDSLSDIQNRLQQAKAKMAAK